MKTTDEAAALEVAPRAALEARRAALEYTAQMSALEGLAMSAEEIAEYRALKLALSTLSAGEPSLEATSPNAPNGPSLTKKPR